MAVCCAHLNRTFEAGQAEQVFVLMDSWTDPYYVCRDCAAISSGLLEFDHDRLDPTPACYKCFEEWQQGFDERDLSSLRYEARLRMVAEVCAAGRLGIKPKNHAALMSSLNEACVVEVDGEEVGGILTPPLKTEVALDGTKTSTVSLTYSDGTIREVLQSSRILEYGRSSWRNLVAHHVFQGAANTAGRLGWRIDESYADVMHQVLNGDDEMIDSNMDSLSRALRDGSSYESFIDVLLSEVKKRIEPAEPEELRFACDLIVRAFGGNKIQLVKRMGDL